MAITDDLANAIARMEGYFVPNTLAAQNNNPGNLRAGALATGTDAHGFATYDDPESGWTDLKALITRVSSTGVNLYEFFGGKAGVYPGYAPAADSNEPNKYADFVASVTGLDPSAPLADQLGAGQAESAGGADAGWDPAAASATSSTAAEIAAGVGLVAFLWFAVSKLRS